jgi:hypothetical protein
MESTGDGSRKRKEVMYDDGLTEKQFLRMVDKQAIGEEAERAASKASRQTAAAASAGDSAADAGAVSAATGSELTDWTFRKIISCTKPVIALKDPSTKRRLCEVFLERPSPEQYPDYYEMIEKPLSINDILRKCRVKLYSNMHEFREDWRIIIANAKQFNGEGSWVVEDAKALERELERLLKKNGFNEDSIPKPSPPKKKKLRIKLSLKSLKKEEAKKPEPEPEEQPEEEIPTKSSRGRKTKKRNRST